MIPSTRVPRERYTHSPISTVSDSDEDSELSDSTIDTAITSTGSSTLSLLSSGPSTLSWLSSHPASDDDDVVYTNTISSPIRRRVGPPIVGPTSVELRNLTGRRMPPAHHADPFADVEPSRNAPLSATDSLDVSYRREDSANPPSSSPSVVEDTSSTPEVPTRAPQTARLLFLPLEAMRLLCDYLPVVDLLHSVAKTCSASRGMLIGTASTPEVRYWQGRYAATMNVIVSGDRQVHVERPDIFAQLKRFTSCAMAPPLSLVVPSETARVPASQLMKAVAFAERRRLDPVIPVGDGQCRIVLFVEPNSDDPPRDMEAEIIVAQNIAKSLSWCYLNGHSSLRLAELEGQRNYRAAVASGTAVGGDVRDGFGVLLPMYCGLDDDEGRATHTVEATENHSVVAGAAHDASLQQLGYQQCPTLPGTHQRIRPFFALQHMTLYWWMVEHCILSNVKHYAWPEEQKLAICATILSPSGQAVEVRLYGGGLQGSFPRFFVKCVMTEAISFPAETIAVNYAANSVELFCGGYGRVEVDIPPRVQRAAFEHMRVLLALPETFPLKLLWNLVCGATGGVPLLMSHNDAFLTIFRHQTFADVADAVLG